jgi:hypothetical protein
MGHTFQLITRTLSLTRASSISGKFIHGLARKRLLFGCCCGAGWGFAWACCLTFFRSLRSFRFSDTVSRSGVNSRVLSSMVNDNLAVQSRGPADAWGANERVRENRVETADLVFGCLRLAFRIPLPLTVTDSDSDTTCGAIGQGTPGFRNNAPAQACDELHSLPPSLGTLGRAKLSPPRQPCPPQFGRAVFPINRAFATHSMTATSPQSFSSPDLPNKFGNFDLIRTEKLGLADIVLSKYRSRETGLTVVHLDYEGTWRELSSLIARVQIRLEC